MSFLSKLFGPARQPVAEVHHPELGALLYDRESESWGKSIVVTGQEFRLSVAGDTEPDPALMNRATTLESELPSLVASLPSFLEAEAKKLPELASEICSLTIADVAVWWPKNPEAVMVWFDAPTDERVWHCDSSNGVLGYLCSIARWREVTTSSNNRLQQTIGAVAFRCAPLAAEAKRLGRLMDLRSDST